MSTVRALRASWREKEGTQCYYSHSLNGQQDLTLNASLTPIALIPTLSLFIIAAE